MIAGASLVTACGQGSAPAPAAAPSASTTAIDAVLRQSWDGYRRSFIDPAGRVSDPRRNGDATSEGQSYALLRAVWMGDRGTFDSVWRWTTSHLQVRGDHLFAWLYGGHAGQGDGVLDRHSATDADTDIALSLLLAARRWGSGAYHDAGTAVASDIWDVDTTDAAGLRVVGAGDWAVAQRDPGPVVNPSYLAPYAYRVFAAADRSHPWSSAVDGAYALLDRCSAAGLDGRPGAGLPPNWCVVSRADGTVTPFRGAEQADDYGYDAFRVMWRVALDDRWNGDDRARDYLRRSDRLRADWRARGRLASVYGHDGSVVSDAEDPTVYGGDIGDLLPTDATAAQAVLRGRLLAAFSRDGGAAHFGDPADYYEQNWVWFGIALAGDRLDDFSGGR